MKLKKHKLLFVITLMIATVCLSYGNPKQPPNLYELGDNEFFKVRYFKKGESSKTIWFYKEHVSLDKKHALAMPSEIIDNFNSSFASYYSSTSIDRSFFCEDDGVVKYEVILKRKFLNSRKWKFNTNSTCVGPLLFQYLPDNQPQENWPDVREVFKDLWGDDNNQGLIE